MTDRIKPATDEQISEMLLVKTHRPLSGYEAILIARIEQDRERIARLEAALARERETCPDDASCSRDALALALARIAELEASSGSPKSPSA